MVPIRIANKPVMPGVRGRFAPSPTGDLHFGSLVTALGSWLRTRSQGGAWIVRMEDIDGARSVAGAAERILAALRAFGLESDEPVARQSDRLDLYESAFQSLQARSAIFPCHCSRSDLARHNGIHPRSCIDSAPSGPAAWRLRTNHLAIEFTDRIYGTASQRLDHEVGDFVLRRADGTFTYHLAVVVDDSDQTISEVVRGADLLDSTPRQIFLQRQLGLATPDYLHLPLATDSSGRKLSKHDCARPVDPSSPLPALQAALAFLGQAIPSARRVDALLQEATERFNANAIPRSAHEHAAMRKD